MSVRYCRRARSRRPAFHTTLLAALLLLFPHTPRAAAADPELEALRERLYCPILSRLQVIHAHPPTPHDRFLVVGLKDRREYYVQCLFYDDDRRLLCEVASGAWGPPGTHLVPPEKLPRLTALGFSTEGSKSNYQRRRRVSGLQSLAETADTMVRAFYEVYGIRADADFTLKAPLVRQPPPTGSYFDGHCEDATS